MTRLEEIAERSYVFWQKDDEYIARAREDIPWLLDEVKRLQDTIERVRMLAERLPTFTALSGGLISESASVYVASNIFSALGDEAPDGR